MSKTITNWKGTRRVTAARSRVRLGWRRRLRAAFAYERRRRQLMDEAGAIECNGEDCEV